MLLEEDRSFLKQERCRARKLTSGIKGFGSFTQRSVGKKLTESRSQICLKCNDNSDRQDEDKNNNLGFLDHPLCEDDHGDRVSLLST